MLTRAGTYYQYDKNGNQIKDSDRKICAIQYNLLNLPQIIQFENGNQIVHCYDAEGHRYQTIYYTRLIPLVEPATDIVSITSSAGYLRRTQAIVGNKRYLAMQNIWSLDYVLNPEGYTRFSTDGSRTPYYYIKDYLGNVREVYKRVSSTQRQLAQRTQYYPSGLPWGSGTGASAQPFKYNGKEFVEMHGLDEYDSEARWYYPQLMRTTTMDPLCEKYYSISPYSWCANNPVRLIDPDGRDWYYTLDDNGNRVYSYDENVYSQDDVSARGINGTYAGITTSYSDTYYGLFGYRYTDDNDKIFAEQMDQFLINEAISNRSGEGYHMNFKIPKLENGQSMKFNYAGGVVLYSQVEKNKLHLEDWGHNWSNSKDFMTNRGFSGYVIKLENSKGFDPVNIIYKDKSQQEHVYDCFVKTLYKRKRF